MFRESLRTGHRAPLLQMPTGAGKTHVGLRLAEIAAKQSKRVLWLAHREELVAQPKVRMLEEGWPLEQLAVIQAGHRSGLETASLTIASIQTLVARGLCPPADVIVFDEARHYVAKDWHGRVASQYANAVRVGLDATPVRADGAALGDLFDDMLVPTSVAELVAAGSLMPATIIAPAMFQEHLCQDPVEAYLEHARGSRAVVFCSTVHQAKELASRFRETGIQAESLDAKTDDSRRRSVLRRLTSGELLVVTNVRILTEGTDIPPIETVIHAAKCGSLADWLQKSGRGLRPSPETGKTGCKVIDLFGHIHIFGFLDDPHDFSLTGFGMGLKEGLPPIAQCPKCFAWGRSKARCSRCGNELPMVTMREPQIKAADMQEVRRVDTVDTRRERLLRWAIDARRRGLTGKSLWQVAHRYFGTYGQQAPKEWILEALAASEAALQGERRRRADEASPLLMRMNQGGGR